MTEALDQLKDLLEAAGLDAKTGDGEVLVSQGSGVVAISVGAALGQPLTLIRATVLDRLNVRRAHERGVLLHLNALNRDGPIGSLWLDEQARTIALEHRILGVPDVRALVLAIACIAHLADDLDDGLRAALDSGRRGDRRRRWRWPSWELPRPSTPAPDRHRSPRPPGDDILDV